MHNAARAFRHYFDTLNIGDYHLLKNDNTIIDETTKPKATIDKKWSLKADDAQQTINEERALFLAYIRTHFLLKLTTLRLDNDEAAAASSAGDTFSANSLGQSNNNHSQLRQVVCTQSWPGRLSDIFGQADGNENMSVVTTVGANDLNMTSNNINNNNVLCQNPAEVWCDYPSCNHARCGAQGCLRCYRFLPNAATTSAVAASTSRVNLNNSLARECSDRNYNLLSFVKCSWCHASFCNEHGDRYFQERCIQSASGVGISRADRERWYKCDECNLSSCPDCVSQVFISRPNMDGCQVVTAGRNCKRKVCTNCIWYVGRKKQNSDSGSLSVIPGGNIVRNESNVLTLKGMDGLAFGEEWENDVETCCSKCLRHVEFRLKELAGVQESFGGFMP